jgi:hypothetical protein
VNLNRSKDGFQGAGAEPAMGIQYRAGLLWDVQRRSHISIAAALDMSLEQQALHLAALGLLLFNLVERELQRTGGCQPRLQQGELEGRWSGDGVGAQRFKHRE